MRRLSILALAIALLAAGFLGGRWLTLAQATQAEADLKQRVSQLEAKLEALASQSITAEDLHALAEELKRQREESARKASDTQERLTSLGSRLAQLESQVNALTSQGESISQLESQLRTQGDRLQAVEESFREIFGSTEEMQRAISELKDQVSQLSQTLEEVRREVEEGDRWAAQEDLRALLQRVESLEGFQQKVLSRLDQLSQEVEGASGGSLQIGVVNLAQVYSRFFGLDPRKLERALEEVGQAGNFDLLVRVEGNLQRDLVLYARPGSLIDVTEQVMALLEQEATGNP